MSFKYKGVIITMNNYLEVFKDYEPDIIDEVRSAVLDDTPISPFIKPCRTDSYRLGQFRMALREYIPKEYLNPSLSGQCIYLIRHCYKVGVDLSPILRYIKGTLKLECDSIERILRVMLIGGDIRKIDFTVVPRDIIGIICEGLIKGYPMWLCISNEEYLTPSFIRQLMKGMQLQIDIHPFLNGKWTEEQLVMILSSANAININELLEYVNYKFSIEHLVEVIDAARNRLDYSLLCLQDDDGSPSFNSYQMAVLRNALRDDVITKELYNPNMNDMDMQDLYEKLLAEKERQHKPVLRGRLKK